MLILTIIKAVELKNSTSVNIYGVKFFISDYLYKKARMSFSCVISHNDGVKRVT